MSGAARYQIVDEIAAGGMGVVYLALRTDAAGRCEPVAIKRLHAHLLDDPGMIESFVDEARIASRLDHPSLVRVHDVTPIDDELVIVMDWVEGLPLSALLKRRREPLPIPVVRRVLVDALEGLHSAHELADERGVPLGVVHRDVSPQNMLVGGDGRTRITDFGIALARGRLAPTTIQGGVKGKLPYLSPEQVHRAPIDRRCDLFAFGAVAWELLVGRRLFGAGTEGETLAMILHEPIPPPSNERLEVPLDLDEAILRALERKPARRFGTAAEFARAIEDGGPLATREEVGRLVIALAGTSLAARRQKLARAMERPAPPRLLREELTTTTLRAPVPEPGRAAGGPLPSARPARSPSPSPPSPSVTPSTASSPSLAPTPVFAIAPPGSAAPASPSAAARSSTPMLLGVVALLLLAIVLVVKSRRAGEAPRARVPEALSAPSPIAPPHERAAEPPLARSAEATPLGLAIPPAPPGPSAPPPDALELPVTTAAPSPRPHRSPAPHARRDAGVARQPFMPDDL